jgi:hypothetical protein
VGSEIATDEEDFIDGEFEEMKLEWVPTMTIFIQITRCIILTSVTLSFTFESKG